ncbi:MAG: bifunctional YncE family protein/alkaline phosphatase family protein [Verrucomicrobia bacterium]|nr:bifunctional YncE family protein/alkaline phosphatase family protein [Verrucomicrobiota bacterium]
MLKGYQHHPLYRLALAGTVAVSTLASSSLALAAEDESPAKGTFVPTGSYITPKVAPKATYQALNPGLTLFPKFVAGGANSVAQSPDGKTLVVLCSGHNDLSVPNKPDINNEYLFVFDISSGQPAQKQVITIPNAYIGIKFNPAGTAFYVAGGLDTSNQDYIFTYTLQGGQWAQSGAPIKLGHTTTNGLFPTDLPPVAGGLDITQDGKTLVVTNLNNDSITFVNLTTGKVVEDFDLRPGKIDPSQKGVPGGEYPYWVAVKGNTTAYVGSLRDREVDVVDFSTVTAPKLVTRIAVAGNPLKMVFNKAQTFLYVTEDNSDLVDIIDATNNILFQSVIASAPDRLAFDKVLTYRGSAPTSAALSPDENTLYVTLGGTNAVSVISGVPFHPDVIGLIPTGFHPTSITLSTDGGHAYVADGKGVTGPNPGETYFNQQDPNQYVEEIQKSYLQSFAIPNSAQLEELTEQVAANNRFTAKLSAADQALITELQHRIKHVIYIVKENRTYDQILGDLDRGNGDPSLVDFGENITPNFHAIARQFVDLDNFYNTGDVSGDGHAWSFAGRENEWITTSIPQNYSSRGLPYDTEGQNRDVNVGLSNQAARLKWVPIGPTDPDILPGVADAGATDGPDDDDVQQGFIWDAVTEAGKTFRNYGYHCDQAPYFLPTNPTPVLRLPAQTKTRVAFPSRVALLNTTDPYFRSFDNNLPDYWREKEWEREFDGYVKNNNLPALSMVRLMHDHMGSFGSAIDKVNTPETQQADHDYACALLIQKIANSPYKYDTLVFMLEDDSQDGADHVDSHRSVGYIVGPYVKQGVVVSQRYTTVNMLRTIEDILGVDHVDVLTASAQPMTAAFDLSQKEWNFTATPSDYLYNTALPLPPRFGQNRKIPHSTHSASYWAAVTKGMDFRSEDRIESGKFNRIIWTGLHGNKPYPTVRSGLDLREHRALILKKDNVAAN